MATQRLDKIFAAVDVGSSKVSALIAGRTEEGELKVLGTGQRESRGVKRGYVADVGQCEMAIRSAVEQAESIAGMNVHRAWVGFAAGGLDSHLTSVELELGGHRVEQDDVDHLLDAGRQGIDARGKMVLHAQPALYTLDGLTGVRNPIGLHADRLGVDIQVVLADASPVRNVEMAVCAAHMGVEAIIAAPVAAGIACLTEEERELGVALVEIGASITNISLYAGGVLVGLETLAVGGADITDDIASAFSLRRHQAERLKCFDGSALSSPRDNHDMIDVERDRDRTRVAAESERITRAQLVTVIRQRLDLLVGDIRNVLTRQGFMRLAGRQIVVTGGGADLKGFAEFAQSAFDRPVRIGRPRGLSGIPEAHGGPGFSTLMGLVLYAANAPVDLRTMSVPSQSGMNFAQGSAMGRLFRVMRRAF